jgi:predicted ATPase/DNA-binding winged helix-turn-helix (wHTH) protein
VSSWPGTTQATSLLFGPFRLLPAQSLLLENDKPVRIGSRGLHILIALVAAAGELVSKEELIAVAWPSTTVDEANLRVHVAGLRKLLGDGQAGARYIVNEVGRGYRFIAPVLVQNDRQPSAVSAAPAESNHNLPALHTRMVGRSDIVAALADQLQQRQFITIVGPGGIGKTTVAVAVAEQLSASYEGGIRFVDLAPLGNPLLVPSALASALGFGIRSEHPIPDLVAFLHDKRMLLVLDSCEHVLDAAANLVEEILKSAPHVHILATSREPLRTRRESVQRLAPLGVPEATNNLSAADAMTFPAIQLFVERVAANLEGFEISDADAPVVADICRRLDGIALAVELAAGRVDTFGVRGVAALLDDRFRLLTRGPRATLPRHQTLSAALDWSYEVLAESERITFRRLAIFAGGFTFEAASAVIAGADIGPSDVIDHLANLVAKSLVSANVSGANVHYRLLDTTRAYALQKLTTANELEMFAGRHAEYYRDLFDRAEADREKQPAAEWLAVYGYQIDNVRSALDWAFSPVGNAALGVDLTLAAVPLWTHLSLNAECRTRVETALEIAGPAAMEGGRREMQLFAALGGALLYTKGAGPEMAEAWAKVLAIAEKTGDIDYQLRALWGLWVVKINSGEYRPALAFAQKFNDVAVTSADVADPLIGDRIMGFSLYYLGDQAGARLHTERMLERYVAPKNRLHIIRYQFDQRVMAHITLAGILWLQGFADQAMRLAESTVDEAAVIDHPISLTYTLAQTACPTALYTGNLPAAEQFVKLLLERAARHTKDLWTPWGLCFRGTLLIKQGHLGGGVKVLEAALAELPENAFHMRYISFLGELADGLGRAGKSAKGLTIIDKAIDQSDRTEERLCIAELLRIKGAIVLTGRHDVDVAEGCFHASLDWARRQNALAWELRTATSLAKLRSDQGRTTDAIELLAPIYNRFTEGFETADLRTAKSLLDDLARI